MSKTFASWWMGRFPEHPRKMKEAKACLDAITWTDGQKALKSIFSIIDNSATSELEYYFRRRKSRAVISTVTRLLAWIFGSIGILLPLIAAADDRLKSGAALGFVFIAAGASFLAANSLFAGTIGHVNFVTAQIDLEHLIARSRLEWAKMLSELNGSYPTDQQLGAAFDLFQRYNAGVYNITMKETAQWRIGILAELDKFGASLIASRDNTNLKAGKTIRGDLDQKSTLPSPQHSATAPPTPPLQTDKAF